MSFLSANLPTLSCVLSFSLICGLLINGADLAKKSSAELSIILFFSSVVFLESVIKLFLSAPALINSNSLKNLLAVLVSTISL